MMPPSIKAGGNPMRRRDLLLRALAVPLLPTPLLAQTPEKVWRVGLAASTRLLMKTGLHATGRPGPRLNRIDFVLQ